MTAIEPGRGFTWVTGGPGVQVTARHSVEASGSGSRATLSLVFSGILGPLVGWVTADLNRRYLKLEAAGLKQRAEIL